MSDPKVCELRLLRSRRGLALTAGVIFLALCLVRPGAQGMRSRIVSRISSALGRPVEASSVSLRFLPRPGFELTHLPVPPSTIASRSDTQYFTITRAGACDDLLNKSREIGVYVPDSIPDPQVELLIIYES